MGIASSLGLLAMTHEAVSPGDCFVAEPALLARRSLGVGGSEYPFSFDIAQDERKRVEGLLAMTTFTENPPSPPLSKGGVGGFDSFELTFACLNG